MITRGVICWLNSWPWPRRVGGLKGVRSNAWRGQSLKLLWWCQKQNC